MIILFKGHGLAFYIAFLSMISCSSGDHFLGGGSRSSVQDVKTIETVDQNEPQPADQSVGITDGQPDTETSTANNTTTVVHTIGNPDSEFQPLISEPVMIMGSYLTTCTRVSDKVLDCALLNENKDWIPLTVPGVSVDRKGPPSNAGENDYTVSFTFFGEDTNIIQSIRIEFHSVPEPDWSILISEPSIPSASVTETSPRLDQLEAGVISVATASAKGVLEAQFNQSGYFTFGNSSDNDTPNTMALNADGSVLIAGRSGNSGIVWKVLLSGALDLSFGGNGTGSVTAEDIYTYFGAQSSPSEDSSQIHDISIDPDGKIVVAGTRNKGFFVGRMLANGTPDSTFATSGLYLNKISGYDSFYSIARHPDGGYLIAGETWAGNRDLYIAKFTSSGQPDASFGTNGMISYDGGSGTPGTSDMAQKILILPDRSFLVLTNSENGSGNMENDVVIWKFKPDGSPDLSYGTNGRFVKDFAAGQGDGPDDDRGQDMSLMSDGSLIVAGHSFGSNSSYHRMMVMKLTPSGQPDTGFSDDGFNVFDVNGNDHGRDVLITPDQKILVSGYSGNGSDNDLVVWRLLGNGAPDTSFGQNGLFRQQENAAGGTGQNNHANSMLLAPDGSIYLTGPSFNGSFDDATLWILR